MPALASTMLQPDRPLRLLLVVDGYFSLGSQAKDDSSFSISWLISVLTTHPKIKLDTAHREGRQNATIPGKFNFASSVANLSFYDEIWMLGYNGINSMDPTNALFFKDPITEDELLALA